MIAHLHIDPAVTPAVLDTATWSPACAWQQVLRVGDDWRHAQRAWRAGAGTPVGGMTPALGALIRRGAALCALVALPDGQQVLLELGHAGACQALGEPLGRLRLKDGLPIAAYPTDAAVLDRYCRILAPLNGPRALGAVPRLGIGSRMTTAVWPGIFSAMTARGCATNPIQNSVRELHFLDTLHAGEPAERNYACGFGTIESGYTGSTFEGLWVAGVLAALHHPTPLRYGADADHLQVKRGPDGLARARRLLLATRYYSFYTLDMSDILRYQALGEAADPDVLDESIPHLSERRAILADHRAPFGDYRLSEEMIQRYAAKYWDALDALETLSADISALKGGQPFDLEFTIDEHPPDIGAFECLTSPEELLFILREIVRRGLPVTHIAPNYGAEKGWDYRGADGLAGLETRVRTLHALADAFGMLLDFHSADDLTAGSRAALRRATGGRLHYKVSPMLQLLFAEVLQEHAPDLFLRWWDDALGYARHEASDGSAFAAACLRAYADSADQSPSRHHAVFHHFSFAFVGRRDAEGQFLHRHEFYTLSPAFYQAYQQRLTDYVGGLANELFEE